MRKKISQRRGWGYPDRGWPGWETRHWRKGETFGTNRFRGMD